MPLVFVLLRTFQQRSSRRRGITMPASRVCMYLGGEDDISTPLYLGFLLTTRRHYPPAGRGDRCLMPL